MMNRRVPALAGLAVAGIAAALSTSAQPSLGPPPAWAYFVSPSAAAPGAAAAGDEPALRLPGSAIALTGAQLRDLYAAPDWHPAAHPPMPEVVARGRKPELFACGYCHLPNGQGRPENAALAGLSVGYITQQIADYKAGLRRSSEPAMRPPALMLANAKHATDEDVQAAAAYFASLPYQRWVRVVEAASVPQTRVLGALLVPVPGGTPEPIGQRIIEVPEDPARTELRDPSSGFIAYVPPGSLARGEALVRSGSGALAACTSCHGAALRGAGDAPPLAGRSPSYLVRQLYDFRSGARTGRHAEPMQPVSRALTLDDMVAVTAYAASLAP